MKKKKKDLETVTSSGPYGGRRSQEKAEENFSDQTNLGLVRSLWISS